MSDDSTFPSHVSFKRETRPDAECPNCGHVGMRTFYRVNSVPVHSVLLMDDRNDALAYPKRDLELAFCPSCAFICNIVFDPSVHEYCPRYEETQGYSPTFNGFARDLAKRLVAEFELGSKRVLEIGCGKGEFLVMLVEEGAESGVGVDPSYRDDRLNSPALERIQFIQDFYTEKYADVEAEFICCRHTLEHIDRTQEFVQLLRKSIGAKNTPVMFELPDTVRELREGVFWDLYYEHCSYFSPGSLSRLFRGCRFEVDRVWKEYDDQYLLLTATPAAGQTQARLEAEDDIEEMIALVDGFEDVCGRKMSYWLRLLKSYREEGKRVALWGGGSKAVSFLTTLGLSDEVEIVVDINPHKHGKFLPGAGHEVVPPSALHERKPDLVIVMNPIYKSEIRNDLRRLGIEAKVAALD